MFRTNGVGFFFKILKVTSDWKYKAFSIKKKIRSVKGENTYHVSIKKLRPIWTGERIIECFIEASFTRSTCNSYLRKHVLPI